MGNPTRIAIAHASVGSGHRIAAQSVAAQLRSRFPDVQVDVLDVLAFGTLQISGDTASTAFTGRTAPLYNAVWGNAGIGRVSMAASRPVLALAYHRFTTWLAENRPDVVIATHALAANLALQATHRAALSQIPVVAVATDYGLHGFWPRRGLALFCVANDSEREELLRRGTPDSDIAVTGIPVRAQFETTIDRGEARLNFELPHDRRVVLALAGATQPGPYARFKSSLAVTLPAIAALPNTTVAVVTGRDETFADELRSRVAGFGSTNVRVLGYVDRMAEVMCAADVVVCKPGGLVTAECVAIGLPLVLVGPTAGQERANAKSLTHAGAAVYDDDPRRLAEVVRKTLASPGKIERMRVAARTLAHPGAARAVAEQIERLLSGEPVAL
jgi:processive 1,2-diacylglycerol beta-glucosyltransferase